MFYIHSEFVCLQDRPQDPETKKKNNKTNFDLKATFCYFSNKTIEK